MRTELTTENIEEFRERFGTLHDAVIHSFHYDLFSKTAPEKLTIKIGTRDWISETAENWLNITFEIEDVTKVILRKPSNYIVSIVFSLGIGFLMTRYI